MDLQRVYFGNTLEHWTQSVALTLALWIAFWLGRKVMTLYLGRIAEQKHNAFYETLSQLIQRTKPFFLLTLSASVAIRPLTLPPAVDSFVDKALIVALVIQFGLWGGAFLHLWIEPYLTRSLGLKSSVQDSKIAAVSFLIRVVFFSLLIIWGLDNLGVNVSALVAGLGVGGVAVALATQNILGDLFSSLSITLDQPFQVGDYITVDTHTGMVEKIGLKTTRLRSVNGEQLIFSNTDMLSSRVQNWRRMKERRVVLRIGATYETPVAKLKRLPELMKKAVESAETTRFEYAHLAGLGASSIDFELIFWIQGPEKTLSMEQQEIVLLGIIDAFQKEGVDFAYPTQTIYMANSNSAPQATQPAQPRVL